MSQLRSSCTSHCITSRSIISSCWRRLHHTIKKNVKSFRALRPIGRHWSPFPKAISQTPVFTLRDHRYGASVSRGVPVNIPAMKPVPNYTAWWQRHICVWTTCLRSLPGSVQVQSRTCASPLPQDYKSDTLPLDYRATLHHKIQQYNTMQSSSLQ